MPDFNDDLRLLVFLLIEAPVCFASWRFAGRFGRRGWRALDAGLVSLAVRYGAVAVPGVLGCLSAGPMIGGAAVMAGGLLVAARGGRPRRVAVDAWKLGGLALAVGYAAAVCWQQRYLPAVSTDALTYHLPAVAQWLRDGRIGLVPTWFFNPANTYSPLGGSVFYAWVFGLLGPGAPGHLAQAAMVPLIYLGGFAIARGARARRPAAAMAAAALCVARPIVDQLDKGKDDLFLLACFALAAAALAGASRRDRFTPWRVGLAVGLFLSIKVTALLALPVLLLAAGRRRLRWRGAAVVVACVCLLAGPWYVRNAWLTGNPLFPTRVFGLPGLFTTARSDLLRTPTDAAAVLLAGPFAVPKAWAAVLAAGWVLAALRFRRKLVRSPVSRLVLLGPPVGLTVFLAVSPYAETRFLLPALLLASAATAVGRWGAWTAGASLVIAAATGVVGLPALLATYLATGVVTAAVLLAALRWGGRVPKAMRRGGAVIAVALAGGGLYVNWAAYLNDRTALRFAAWSAYSQAGAWAFLDARLPADATVAYTGSPLVFPMLGADWRRHVVYVPTRPGVRSLADLPWLGDRLTGEAINAAAVRVTIAEPDEVTWLANLRASGATVLAVFRHDDIPDPAEKRWADASPKRFVRVYADGVSVIYAISRDGPNGG